MSDSVYASLPWISCGISAGDRFFHSQRCGRVMIFTAPDPRLPHQGAEEGEDRLHRIRDEHEEPAHITCRQVWIGVDRIDHEGKDNDQDDPAGTSHRSSSAAATLTGRRMSVDR